MNGLKSALGNAKTAFEFKGKLYQLEEFDLNDIADIEEQLGDIGQLNPTKTAHQRLILWLALRRADEMLTPPERRACNWRLTLVDVGTQIKASDLRSADTLRFVAAILRASGLYGGEDQDQGEKKETGDPEPPSTGETSSPS